jgi:hypothetical protein
MLRKVRVELEYEIDDPKAIHGFGDLHTMLDAMRAVGVEPEVHVVGVDKIGTNSGPQAPPGAQNNAQNNTPPPVNSVGATRTRRGRPATGSTASVSVPASAPDNDPVPDDLNGSSDPADADAADDDLGLTDPGKTPAELREDALRIVRSVFNAGHRKEVKALQAELKVAKFYDVPERDGEAFYRRVVQLAEQVGMRV